jgi:protein SCO1/2
MPEAVHRFLAVSHGSLSRALLRACLLGALLLGLAGCGEGPPPFRTTDITGMDVGPDFDFGLRDPAGQVRRVADYRGQVVALFFGFTQCPDVCPTALVRFAAIKRQLGDAGRHLRVVFISLDPERDTPELLANYVAAFDPAFVGLRGDEQATRQVAKAFRVFYRKVPTGSSYTLDHSAVSYVFDGEGKLRLLLQPAQNMDDIVHDLKLLIDTTTHGD